ncbi:LPS export ABC transporter permease LptF [Pseudomonas sp. WJP1]|uniref:LPS export ABC transporter permease LptF n=1 Tax=Pseudomonas sp. WJP1 TaxID=2986947 RepID=UPI00300DF19F
MPDRASTVRARRKVRIQDMFLIERYVIAEIRRPVIVMVSILVFIFASYSAERYLADAVEGTLAMQDVLEMVFYKVLIALEMLVPVALYASVTLAVGRLCHDSEIIAIAASGASPLRIYRAVLLLAIPVSLAVAMLSLYGRPWAYTQAYVLEQQSRTDLDVNHLQAQRFNLNNDNGRMILAERIDRTDGRLHDVLIYDPGDSKTRVFRAEQARILDPDPDDPIVELTQGHSYLLKHSASRDISEKFEHMRLHLLPIERAAEGKRKAAPNDVLKASSAPSDKAELQWRQTRGVSATILALLAIPLSRTRPRQGRFATLLPVTAVFALIYYAADICKTMVGNSTLPLYPGLWTVPLLMSLALLVFLARDLANFRFGYR